MSKTDYERGVEQASAMYMEVIREYVAENAKLRELARNVAKSHARVCKGRGTCAGCVFLDGRWSSVCPFIKSQDRLRELGIEVTP